MKHGHKGALIACIGVACIAIVAVVVFCIEKMAVPVDADSVDEE